MIFHYHRPAVNVIEHPALGLHLNIYPNPVKENLFLNVNLRESENISLQVIDAMGKKHYSSKHENLTAGKHTFEINSEILSSGIYFIRIETDKGSVIVKFVK